MDERARTAARNNAAWCGAVWRSHGLPTIHEAGFRATARRAPAMYPDAVTVGPVVAPRAILARIDDSQGCSIKDSFIALDLGAHGYDILFGAEWYWREPGPGGPAGDAWSVVGTPAELATWARAHGGGDVFRPALLEDTRVRVLVRRDPGDRVAGAIASLGAGVVGVSNVFGHGAADEAWEGLVDAIERLLPGLPIVGYGTGEDLGAAVRAGFDPVGPLRVWIRR
jgi:hypothetical protein